jgi:tRNA (guanine-N7-)-methyltransferase
MRQRTIKNIDEKMENYRKLLIKDPQFHKGRWRYAFPDIREKTAELYVEIGTGKGNFILEAASRDPGALFLGVEGSESALIRALEKTKDSPLPNLRFCAEYVLTVDDVFAEREISGLYLHFSDPWPKKRHAKRRLTSPPYLAGYARALKPGGFLQFKTDNDDFFRYSLEMFQSAEVHYEIVAQTDDLFQSPWLAGNIMTEYEKKFHNLNKSINYLKAVRR